MTNDIPIRYGPWEPDKASFESGSLIDALNVAPVAGGYGPLNGFLASDASLDTPILGAAVLSDQQAQVYIYAGSGDDVYVSNNGGAFASVYTSGTTISDIYRWQFVRFVGKAIAVNPQVAPISGDMGSTLTLLAASAPVAKVAGVVGNFLVLGDLDDGIDGIRPNRIRWSGFRDPTAWGTNIATQADFNDMPDDGGVVQGIVGREFGTVFQRYAISRMTYVGPPTVFQIDVVERKRGAITAGSIIDAGLLSAYIADDGFMLWDGTSSTPIGAQRVNEYFRARLYPGYEDKIVGAFDPLNTSLEWAYPTDASGVLNERLIYSLTENRWTRSNLRGAWFMTGFDIGYTLEQLDAFGPLDDLPFSLDDPKLQGGRARIVGFDTDGNYGMLTGDTLEAVIETGDWQSTPGQMAFVSGARPMCDAVSVKCAVGYRLSNLSEQIAWTSDSVRAADGQCPTRASGRFMRIRETIAGMQSWSRETGADLCVSGGGKR